MPYWKRMSTKVKVALAVTIIVIIVVSSLVGYWYVLRPVPPRDNVGLIEIYGRIYGEARDRVVRMINYTFTNETVKAVVLRVDCPGGSVDAIEEVYMSLLKLRAQKPVVASIVGYGVSGGYYIAIASNLTYATPTSLVGNVGVMGRLPSRLFPSESYVESGPYKVTGYSEKEFAFKLQMVLERFLDVVIAERGERLSLNRTELSKGLVYFGVEAVQNGLVDGMGPTFDAIERSAELAGIEDYGVVRVSEMIEEPSLTETLNASSVRTEEDLDLLQPPPAFHYLYLPTLSPKPAKTDGVWDSSTNSSRNASSADERKFILIDNSHDNAFKGEELTILLSEIVSRNHTARYFEADKKKRKDLEEELEEKLNQTEAFVVLSPQIRFTDSEIDSLRKFVENGGRLLMILDPTRALCDSINSLAVEFGAVFGNGYLYNIEEHYGNYRNLIISDFKESNITRGLKTIVFYTASHIYSNNQVAFTSDRTFSSEGELAKKFSPIAFVSEKGVLAIGDQTFLTEPYCYIEDNQQLVSNVADFLTSTSG